MPRPTRAHGRRGTPVIPHGFDTSHAPVAARTRTARCRIWAPETAPKIRDDLSYDTAPPASAVYDGTCRVQALNAGDASRLVADERQNMAGYLLTLDLDAEVGHGHVVDVYESTDPMLSAPSQRLFVRSTVMGSLRFERDIFCTDQL